MTIRATLIGGPLDGKEVELSDSRDVVQPQPALVGSKPAPPGDYICDLAAFVEGSYRWVWQPQATL